MCLQGGDEEDNYNSCSYSGRDNNTGYLIVLVCLLLFISSYVMCLQGGDEEDNYNSCSYSGRDNNTGYLIVLVCLLLFISTYVMCFVGRRRRR